ncbi:hypothetical protein KUTeg_024886 [Tegillarca granosa]|uniref:Uncharacterized protein n=1 Tax=Tegillarca granosa TaxID=220873 RepID=A0ABQ9DZM0_TEGGR|nr:hypothetical protein KUTeg_024886 [Tegillarca granosa]
MSCFIIHHSYFLKLVLKISYGENYKSISSPDFKPSVKKSDKELEFIPINLHLQRMTVINETKHTTGWYDNITVGAFTAYAQKYKNGGLHRMLRQLKNTYNQDSTLGGATKVQKACNLVKELVSICDTRILQDAAEKYSQSKSEVLPVSMATSGTRKSDTPIPSPPLDDISPEKSWRWSGTDFVKSPTVEPWEMTRLNTEAAVVCLVSMVEDLIANRSGPMDRPKWLNEISPSCDKIKEFYRISPSKIFLYVYEHKGTTRLMHMIKYRRDICFSHAVSISYYYFIDLGEDINDPSTCVFTQIDAVFLLTALVTGFVTRISTCIKDEDFFNQLLNVGVLAQFEGLLSCQGDEMGMIEDFLVAASDLNHVTFQFCRISEEISSPTVSLDSLVKDGEYPDFFRHHMCVSIPLEEEIYNKLPDGLQRGHKVKVTAVFFNIGINEQASLAERFGDTSLQERINAESVAKVFSYVEKYQETIGDPDNGKSGAGSIKELCNKIHYNTMICRKIKGIRFTSCKSAKDRTAMAVTLEQVHILQQEHDLASHVFTQALDCFRSEGVRRENTLKNIGAKKYAFNSLQLLYIPKLYRPPNGTYGNNPISYKFNYVVETFFFISHYFYILRFYFMEQN